MANTHRLAILVTVVNLVLMVIATVRVPFRPGDLEAAARSMACYRSQFSEEVVQRVHEARARVSNGAIPLIPAFPTGPISDLFR